MKLKNHSYFSNNVKILAEDSIGIFDINYERKKFKGCE